MTREEYEDDWDGVEEDDEPAESACPSCGRDVIEDTQKCPHCGDWIIPVDRSGATGRFIWSIVVVLLILAMIAFAIR